MMIQRIDFEFEDEAAEARAKSGGYVSAFRAGTLALQGPIWMFPWTMNTPIDSEGLAWEVPPGTSALRLNGERIALEQVPFSRNALLPNWR